MQFEVGREMSRWVGLGWCMIKAFLCIGSVKFTLSINYKIIKSI